MAVFPREYLDDLSTQRFQENVARQLSKQGDNISSLQETYVDVSFSIVNGNSQDLTHNLGSTPTRWVIIDLQTTNTASVACLSRSIWNASIMRIFHSNTGAAILSGKIRIYK